MSVLPPHEVEAERQLITDFTIKHGGKIIKLQGKKDDGKADGIIEINGKIGKIEVRRKGYPNHKGESRPFKNGWDNSLIKSGVFLNESTINNHKGIGFIYIVDINGYKPRYCRISKDRIEELLRQPYQEQRSTNTGVMQSIKKVPWDWFKEY